MNTIVGFVGLGHMGRPMAERLLSSGFTLRVHNRTLAVAAGLAEKGAHVAATPADAAAEAEIVVTMVADDAALADVTLGENGIAVGLRPGGLHLSTSTVSPDIVRRLASEHRERGSDLVAAPVMGRPDVASVGGLWLLAAGRPELEEQLRPVFAALGRGHTWLGEDPALAAVAKIGANYLLLSMVESAAEAFALVEKSGLPPGTFFEIAKMLMPGAAFEGYGRRMLAGELEPAGFSAGLGLKDAQLALGLARSALAPLPIASVVSDRLVEGVARGRGSWDLATLGLIARERAGLA